MVITIKIQSVSDIITNSSSEVFCRITGDNLNSAYDILEQLFYLGYSEEEPCMEEYDNLIEIRLPYGMYGVDDFYKAGLEALLKDLNCNIEYD